MPLEFDGVNGIIKNTTSDGDVTIKGNDGGSEISLLTFDVSAEGAATFNSTITSTASTTITVADNSDNLTLKSTDADANAGPNLILQRDSGSPADGDAIGRIDFDADNDAGEVTSFFSIRAEIEDASDGTEDGQMKIDQMIAGTAVTALRFKSSETVFNDDSKDVDFRVEGNGDANLLFVDAGNDKIGVGTNSPAKLLSLKKDGGGGAIGIDIHNQGTDAADDALITFETQGHRNYSMGIDRSESAFVVMSEADGLGTARLTIDDSGDAIFSGTVGVPALDIMSGSSIHGTITTSSSSLTLNARNTGIMIFQSGGTERMRIGSDGATTINVSGNEDTLTLKSTDTDASAGPILKLSRDNNSASASDVVGKIIFTAEDGGNNLTDYAEFLTQITDASDGSESVRFIIKGMKGGNYRKLIDFNTTETIFNDESDDLDFRVESNGNANMLFVDGGNDHVNIGTSSDLGGVFNVSGETVMRTSGNSDTLTLKCTDADAEEGPILRLTRDSSSPANNDVLGRMFFTGEDAGSNATNYVQLTSQASNVAEGSETANFQFEIFNSGSLVEFQKFQGGTGTVFNEGSNDLDFRVESNDNANMLKVDGGNNRVGVGCDPSADFHVDSSGGGVIRVSRNSVSTANYMALESDGTDGTVKAIKSLFFSAGGSTRMKIDFEGNLVFNDGQNDCNFRIKSDDLDDMIFVDAGNNRVGVGIDAPDYTFQVDAPSSVATYAANIRSRHTSTPFGLFIKYTSAAPDGSDNQFLVCQDSGTNRLLITSDGDVTNHDNSYGAISDERIKQDIRDSNSQWDDIKAVKVRNYKKKDDVRQYGDNAWEQIGVVAQELETVSPKLIRHNNPNASDILSDSSFGTLWTADDAETQDAVLYTSEDQEVIDGIKNVGDIKTPSTKQVNDIKSLTGEKVKSVNYSILYMKAIKALQEAQTRIETLETKVAALEG